jgi:hypothetical protein
LQCFYCAAYRHNAPEPEEAVCAAERSQQGLRDGQFQAAAVG